MLLTINDFFLQYGYLGMALAAFLAGTFVPFSSEAVLLALLATTDMNPTLTVAAAAVGNIAGSMFNYALGRLGSPQTISRWLKVKPQRLDRSMRWVQRYGVWLGLITFLPVLGTAISVSLGIMRANVWQVLLTTSVGKTVRYLIVILTFYAII